MANGLSERGHEVTVWSHDSIPLGALYKVEVLPWHKFVDTWMGRRLTMGYLGNILALLPSYRGAEAILSHGDSLLLPLRGKPVIRVMHGSALAEARAASNPLRFLAQLGVYVQELISALSASACVGVSENSRKQNPFVSHVVQNGVDTTVFHPDPKVEKAATPELLFVGTSGGRKRGRALLNLFASQVRPRYPDAQLNFVGPEDEQQPGVSYYEGIGDEELANLYRRAWIYVSPSSYEGFGLPYVEAMACGTPVLAVLNPGSREVLGGGEYGRLVHDHEFAGALMELLENAPLRARLAEAGLERAGMFTVKGMIDGYEALLLDVCRGRRAHEGS